jgi:hypothetical protein
MFQRLLTNAKSAVTSLILRYLARASVAIPFVIAAGFALAAITVMFVQYFGHVTAYWVMAGGLAAIGAIAAMAVSAKEHQEEIADVDAEHADTKEMVSEVAVQAPLALLGALFSLPGGTSAALSMTKAVGRNWPLAVLLALIGALFVPTPTETTSEVGLRPNGFHPSPDNLPYR